MARLSTEQARRLLLLLAATTGGAGGQSDNVDTATVTDSHTVTITVANSDTAAVADTSSVRTLAPSTDTAAVSDSTATVVQVATLDTAAASDSSTVLALVATGDTASVADSSTLRVLAVHSDTASVTDSNTVTVGLLINNTDSASVSDATTTQVTAATPDTASVADSTTSALTAVHSDTASVSDSNTVQLGGLSNNTDSAAVTDATTVVLLAPSADTASVADSTTHALTSANTDTASVADSNTVVVGILSANTDSAAVADSTTTRVTDASTDSASVADSSTVRVLVPVSDTASVTDSNTVQLGALSANTDTASVADSGTASQLVPNSDSASVADSTTLAMTSVHADSASVSDSNTATISMPAAFGHHTVQVVSGMARSSRRSGQARASLLGSATRSVVRNEVNLGLGVGGIFNGGRGAVTVDPGGPPPGASGQAARFTNVTSPYSGYWGIAGTIPVTGEVWTRSAFFKLGTALTGSLQGLGGQQDFSNINFQTMQFTGHGTAILAAGVVDVGNGWFRFWHTFTAPASPVTGYGYFNGGDQTYGIMYGPQLERGSVLHEFNDGSKVGVPPPLVVATPYGTSWPSLLATRPVWYLDAGVQSSYPGTGATWANLVAPGTLDAALTAGPTFSKEYGGGLTFNGSTQLGTVGSPGLAPIGGTIFWASKTSFNVPSYGQRTGPLSFRGGGLPRLYLGTSSSGGGTLFSYSDGSPPGSFVAGVVPSLTPWVGAVTTPHNGDGTGTITHYINGVKIGSQAKTGTYWTPTKVYPFHLAYDVGTGEWWAGTFYAALVYDRVLSDLEVWTISRLLAKRFWTRETDLTAGGSRRNVRG